MTLPKRNFCSIAFMDGPNTKKMAKLSGKIKSDMAKNTSIPILLAATSSVACGIGGSSAVANVESPSVVDEKSPVIEISVVADISPVIFSSEESVGVVRTS